MSSANNAISPDKCNSRFLAPTSVYLPYLPFYPPPSDKTEDKLGETIKVVLSYQSSTCSSSQSLPNALSCDNDINNTTSSNSKPVIPSLPLSRLSDTSLYSSNNRLHDVNSNISTSGYINYDIENYDIENYGGGTDSNSNDNNKKYQKTSYNDTETLLTQYCDVMSLTAKKKSRSPSLSQSTLTSNDNTANKRNIKHNSNTRSSPSLMTKDNKMISSPILSPISPSSTTSSWMTKLTPRKIYNASKRLFQRSKSENHTGSINYKPTAIITSDDIKRRQQYFERHYRDPSPEQYDCFTHCNTIHSSPSSSSSLTKNKTEK